VASFTNYVMTLHLLKVHLQTSLSIPITQKCQILSCDTLVANEQYKKTKVTDSIQTENNKQKIKIMCFPFQLTKKTPNKTFL
jgi:hypothetical protein